MQSIDVIGIGALNFDYICKCQQTRGERPGNLPESGIEDIDHDPEELSPEIDGFLAADRNYRMRFGGSAYLTLKTIGSLGLGLRTGFIGVVGTPGDIERRCGVTPSFLDSEFCHFHSREWLFSSETLPGRALVLTHDGERQSIRIAPGANDLLLSTIEKQETDSGVRLEAYLASAKWIHVTSLRDRAQFERIVERLRVAKSMNPYLRASIDPGSWYTRKYSEWLAKVLDVFDFVFLNQKELEHLQGGSQSDAQSQIDRLKSMVKDGTQVLVVKEKAKTELIQFVATKRYPRLYWHERLPWWRIKDDTGAGDVFAGGVIAGMLTSRLLAHQPAPIELGAGLAKVKLQSHDFPTEQLAEHTARFLIKGMEMKARNWRQRLKVFLHTAIGYWVAFVISFASGIASTVAVKKMMANPAVQGTLSDKAAQRPLP
jgi:sugar/nucleoside kinase (ribokinase family)